MNPIQLLNKIKQQIDALNNHTNHLIENNNQPTPLDVELYRKQCAELYELIITFNIKNEHAEIYPANEKLVNKTEQHVMSMEEFEVKEANIISTAVKNNMNEEQKDILFEEEIPLPETVREVRDETAAVNEPAINTRESLNVSYTELSLHEKISGSKQPDLKEKFSDAKVESLKAAINLNKKIAFVNELFKENTVEYAKAIDKLNASADHNEALHYFNELKHQYSWSNDNDLVLELEQLIQKRFR